MNLRLVCPLFGPRSLRDDANLIVSRRQNEGRNSVRSGGVNGMDHSIGQPEGSELARNASSF